MLPFKPVVLLILDGWGLAPPGPGNAVSQAQTPNLNKFTALYPHTSLLASGEAVGLPRGEDGNTETGHLNMGAGHIVYQDLPRINMNIADGDFFKNEAFLAASRHVNKHQSDLHLMGLMGSGGVHSNIEHLFALLHFCKEENLENVYLHLFTDGRDSPPTSAPEYLGKVMEQLNYLKVGKIASIMGRYYAMDRDNRWERTEKAYLALTKGEGLTAQTPEEALAKAYERGETDEFIKPTLILKDNHPVLVKENDAVIFYNFRVDRPRQLTKAFVLFDLETAVRKLSFDPYAIKYYKKHAVETPSETKVFKRDPQIKNLLFITMTEYENGLPTIPAFPPEKIKMPLGKILTEYRMKQLHMSESEKERFVTYYFNGQREGPFSGEEDVIIPSPDVATYDLKPEMSAYELTESLLLHIESGLYDFIVVNFAGPDMVAHTGMLKPSIQACEAVDVCLGKIIPKIFAVNGACLITADHGNVEEMINKDTGGVDTEHSCYPVPFIAIASGLESKGMLPTGILADVAPTVLYLMGIPKTSNMTGRNLLQSVINIDQKSII